VFHLPVGPGVDLVLREVRLADAYHELTLRNRERLRRWEPWAEQEPDLGATRDFLRSGMEAFAAGTEVPAAIRADGEIVGSCGLMLDGYRATAELGFWVDVDHEGRGLVTASCRALVALAFSEREVRRVQLRTDVDNHRSVQVAERLGFRREGVLRSAQRVGGRDRDVAMFALVAGDEVAT
jgi:ribosomal-protein-serine acetyltransferase